MTIEVDEYGLPIPASKTPYRHAATQMMDGVLNGMIDQLKKHPTSKNALALIALLQRPGGRSLAGLLVGTTLPFIPGIGDDPRVEYLAATMKKLAHEEALIEQGQAEMDEMARGLQAFLDQEPK
jgi:hypothetical protein